LLTMKKVLLEFFPPMHPIVDHPMLMEWLYSVPFPSPPQSSSWNYYQKSGTLHHVENIIPNKSYNKDDTDELQDKSEDELDEDIQQLAENRNFTNSSMFQVEPLLTRDMSYVALFSEELKKVTGQTRPPHFGDHQLLKYVLPHTSIKRFTNLKKQQEQYSWFCAVFISVYGDIISFQPVELKNCLFAFWKRHTFLHNKHKSLKCGPCTLLNYQVLS